MHDEVYALHNLLKRDQRYPLDAYVFIREALSYASNVLDFGDEMKPDADPQFNLEATPESNEPISERHLTGQELCEAIRQYALQEFGFMAKLVLMNWGINNTGGFGDIVYNMIEVGLMKKSPNDCRTHFDDVYDFDAVFDKDYELKVSGS